MGKEKITDIEAALRDWDFLQQLPQNIAGFELKLESFIEGQVLQIASYVNEQAHCRVDLTYTDETFDYVPIKVVGLHSFRDERYFCRDKERFAQMMLEFLPKIINDIDPQSKRGYSFEAQELKFPEWEDWKNFPKQIGNYVQFLNPENPVNYINGSIIFLDYTDFTSGNQVYFLYNTFRNELFAEYKKQHFPLTTEAFNAKTLAELTQLIEGQLEETLKSLEKV